MNTPWLSSALHDWPFQSGAQGKYPRPLYPSAHILLSPSCPPCPCQVVDNSKYTVAPTASNTTCFYRNASVELVSGLICIPTRLIASGVKTASGKTCAKGANQYIAVNNCDPKRK